ncbi:hypothetical protein CEXT_453661 [Caerostris extrusa]|uniref:Uncharacterized protein n=1 Tax=Caerostris extrusa TaxID=172846 RepID=A0AAV4TEA1_CAEEX|nr:hypothetical protein CEXT_453661 [Caerostris extrusa]
MWAASILCVAEMFFVKVGCPPFRQCEATFWFLLYSHKVGGGRYPDGEVKDHQQIKTRQGWIQTMKFIREKRNKFQIAFASVLFLDERHSTAFLGQLEVRDLEMISAAVSRSPADSIPGPLTRAY